MKRYVVGISGASGSGYALAFLELLAASPEREIHLIVSDNGRKVMEHECGRSAESLSTIPGSGGASIHLHDNADLFSPPASGSFGFEAMIVIPCSMGSLSEIASGASRCLLSRAADVALKERRTLVLVPREAPYGTIHLRNMLSLSEAGAIILPASPGFYDGPKTIDDLRLFIARRVMAAIGLPTEGREWGLPR